jgi:hypothetical protein
MHELRLRCFPELQRPLHNLLSAHEAAHTVLYCTTSPPLRMLFTAASLRTLCDPRITHISRGERRIAGQRGTVYYTH